MNKLLIIKRGHLFHWTSILQEMLDQHPHVRIVVHVIARANGKPQPSSGILQQFIPCGMAKSVIVDLEAIQIKKEECPHGVGCHRSLNCRYQAPYSFSGIASYFGGATGLLTPAFVLSASSFAFWRAFGVMSFTAFLSPAFSAFSSGRTVAVFLSDVGLSVAGAAE